MEYTRDKVSVVDEDGTYRFVNSAVESMLGFEPEELVGENAFEFVHPEDRAQTRGAFERLVGEESFAEGTETYRHRCADGSWAWLESRVSNAADEELEGYVVSSREVSERKRAMREREQTQARLEEVTEQAGDVLWLFTADWEELVFCNPAYETVYGGSLSELWERPASFMETIHPDDRERVEAAMARLSAGESVEMEYRANPVTDYGRWLWVQGEPIFEDGEVARVAGFSRDVTDRRRRERQLSVMDNLLRHNIRNDMNTILGNASVIESAPAERAAVIQRVGRDLVASAEKQRDIIDLLTDPSTVEGLPLEQTVERAVAGLGDAAMDAVTVSVPDDVTVSAVPELGSAIAELVENALENSPRAEPSVRVSVSVEGERVRLVVADDCPQFPSTERQVLEGDHEMDAVYHSGGLGVWLVYWVVDLSDGDISVRRAGAGNEVVLDLPRGQALDEA